MILEVTSDRWRELNSVHHASGGGARCLCSSTVPGGRRESAWATGRVSRSEGARGRARRSVGEAHAGGRVNGQESARKSRRKTIYLWLTPDMAKTESNTRELHIQDVLEFTDKDLQEVISEHLTGDVLVVAAEDDRLKSALPIKGQVTLFGNHLDFGPGAEFFHAPFYSVHREQDSYLPHNKHERFHFDSNSYDTVISIFSKVGYFQRGPPFLDLTRVVRPGGTLISITGLQPEEPPDHDAKWWVPDTDDAELTAIKATRHKNFQTPELVSIYKSTSGSDRYPDATITTQP